MTLILIFARGDDWYFHVLDVLVQVQHDWSCNCVWCNIT